MRQRSPTGHYGSNGTLSRFFDSSFSLMWRLRSLRVVLTVDFGVTMNRIWQTREKNGFRMRRNTEKRDCSATKSSTELSRQKARRRKFDISLTEDISQLPYSECSIQYRRGDCCPKASGENQSPSRSTPAPNGASRELSLLSVFI